MNGIAGKLFLLKLIKKWFKSNFFYIIFKSNLNLLFRAQEELAQQQLELTRWREKLQNTCDDVITNSISGIFLNNLKICKSYIYSYFK